MFNLGAGEIAVIMIVALLLLGPDKLPELARGIGKFVREFRRQTDDVRGMVEREFYKMDQEVFTEEPVKRIEPPKTEVAEHPKPEGEALPAPEYPSVFPPPEGVVAAQAPAVVPAPVESSPTMPTASTAAPSERRLAMELAAPPRKNSSLSWRTTRTGASRDSSRRTLRTVASHVRGSPGPLEMTTPSQSSSRGQSQGTTVTDTPRFSSERMMLFLQPQSTTITCLPPEP